MQKEQIEKFVKVVILTEGGGEKGFGHVTRCLSLYQAFIDRKIKPSFLVNGDKTIESLLGNIDIEMLDWLRQEHKVDVYLQDADIVVIDSYLAPLSYYQKIASLVKTPVYFDDDIRIDYPRGVILNGAIDAEHRNYPHKRGQLYLLGSAYTSLRKEFWDVPDKVIREEIDNIMITLGGNDFRGLMPTILELLQKAFPYITKSVIVGKAFADITQLESIRDRLTNLIYHPDGAELKNLMLDADIAISGGGQTLCELARVGVPTIAIGLVENQRQHLSGWKKTGFVKYVGDWNDPGLNRNIELAVNNFRSKAIRKAISEKGRKYVDGKGSLLTVNRILNILNDIS